MSTTTDILEAVQGRLRAKAKNDTLEIVQIGDNLRLSMIINENTVGWVLPWEEEKGFLGSKIDELWTKAENYLKKIGCL